MFRAVGITRALARFARTQQPFCLALADIDHFKCVNDRYGHDAGDGVLAATAAHISRSIRAMDEAFGMGGEEFLVGLKNTTLGYAVPIIERLRRDLEQAAMGLPDGRTLRITASFGLAEAAPGLGVDRLIKHADAALYEAKQTGRNRVVCHGRRAGSQ